ncbi:Predicted dehydrogenase [Gracilibacillus ureilyticus]|uniref:Predicted dehydrogenase n=1 Tax=Gracilibacillus ureilyticus TaxID=531814 RepID=A0A1H9MWL0_9BACI|nr:Gfo/Idh/MocA family oxidoreductase [Gracilibacillus ureilyticus]SER27907.1 Predicted dehydrogenase [Gracilibacillus ureilyticus]
MKVKVGLIGTGWFTKHHLHILSQLEEVEVVGFVGSSKEKAEKLAADNPGTKGFGSLEEMIANDRPDAVYICVPPMSHGHYEKLLIEENIPFLIEKPLGTDLAVVREINELVERKNHLTSVGYHFRYSDVVEKWKRYNEKVKTGMVTAGWMGSMPSVYWWRDQSLSGGQFNEQTTHLVDLIRFIYGEVNSVYAQEARNVKAKTDASITVADVGSFTVTMENGIIVQIANTSILPDGTGDVGIKAFTDKGILTWQMQSFEVAGAEKKEWFKAKNNPYLEESKAFIHAVRSDDRKGIMSPYQDAYQSFKVAMAAQKSIREGKVIGLNDLE